MKRRRFAMLVLAFVLLVACAFGSPMAYWSFVRWFREESTFQGLPSSERSMSTEKENAKMGVE